jgi:hypothetical protein
MGFKAVSAVMHHSQAKGNTRLVALAIAQFYDDKGENGAFPKQETIAKLANVSKRTVQRSINELVELGELEVLVHRGVGGSYDRQTNRYFIILDCSENCDRSLNHRNLDDSFDEATRQFRQTKTPKWTDQGDTSGVLTYRNRENILKAVI